MTPDPDELHGELIRGLAHAVLSTLETSPESVAVKLTALAVASGALIAVADTAPERIAATVASQGETAAEIARWGAGWLQHGGRVS